MNLIRITKVYNVPRTTLRDQLKEITPKSKRRNATHNLTLIKEETLIQYILDLNSRGFPPRIDDVKDIADLLLIIRYAKYVGKQYIYRLV